MKKYSLLGLLFIVFFSCRNDVDDFGEVTRTTSPTIIIDEYDPENKFVEGTVFGRVYDEVENPVANALVRYNGNSYTTDLEGRFFIENETLDSEGTFITVDATGYFRGSRRLYPRDGSVNYAYIQLLALDETGTFIASEGGDIEDNNGLRISFSPNSIQSANGGIYNGLVSVAAKWLDPTAPNIAEFMPGDLLGLNARVEEVSLQTYGMIAVELFDENGNSVNIADGSSATLTFPIPQELMDEAPQEIPLWSFEDEQYGIWAEEGTATLQGNTYVGEVGHFSFWNCDAPFPLVYIEGQLVTADGVPLANTSIRIFPDGSNSGRSGITDNEGFFAGKMPQDKDLILKVGYRGEDCEFSSINLGSFSEDTSVDPITLMETGAAFTIEGFVINCDDEPISNGLVRVQIGNERTEIYLSEDNAFSAGILNCDNANEVIITVIDLDNLEKSNEIISPLNSHINFGQVKACGNELTEFFTLTSDGFSLTGVENAEATYENPTSDNYLSIDVFPDTIFAENNFLFIMVLDSGDVGTYDQTNLVRIELIHNIGSVDADSYNCVGQNPLSNACSHIEECIINITTNEGIGGLLKGNFDFSGTRIFTNDMTPYDFSGNFSIPIR